MVNEALSEADVRMKGAVRAFEDDLASIRTGRASPALVDRLLVEYYGTPTSLMQLATISVPNPAIRSSNTQGYRACYSGFGFGFDAQ